MAKASRQPAIKIRTTSISSPVGGLNARDSLADMPESDAIILDNLFPTPSNVQVRNGYTKTTTGLPGWVESLLPYSGLTSTRKLFAASVNGIYDCSSSGAVGAAVVSGLANARFQWINFATAGATYLYAVNGANNPVLYNGSVWQQVGNATAPISITGVDPSTFVHVNAWQNRLYFTQINSTKVWYLPAASVGGAANFIDFGPLFTLGGYLMGMCTWTIDTAQGLTEFAVFVSSEGEVLVYGGFDPTTTATFFKVGQFRMGRPIGRRFFCKNGSDIIFVNADGAVPLSSAINSDRAKTNIAISDKIRNLINTDVQSYQQNFGWQCVLYPMGNKLVINVPVVENGTQYQYVMNTITGSWCTFGKVNSSWLAACFEFWEDNFYFGGSNYVAQCDTTQADNGADIKTTAKQAFNYFGERGRQKYFTLVRPILMANGVLHAAIDLNVNFEDVRPTSMPSFTPGVGSPWDTSPWGSPWTSGNNIIEDWDTPNAVGFCAALYMTITSNNLNVSWQATDFAYQTGGVL